jgi:hypothetical protein
MSQDDLKRENERLRAALEWISHIAAINYEQDKSLKARGARSLLRIAIKADEALGKIPRNTSDTFNQGE